jgi:hypothetical protein
MKEPGSIHRKFGTQQPRRIWIDRADGDYCSFATTPLGCVTTDKETASLFVSAPPSLVVTTIELAAASLSHCAID